MTGYAAEFLSEIDNLNLGAAWETVLFYADQARIRLFELIGVQSGNGSVYTIAVVVVFLTILILVLRPLLKLLVKTIALTAISIVVLGSLYSLPTEQLIAISVTMGMGLLFMKKAVFG